MMPTPFISVIVPIYKVEAFLQECIDSILAQTYTDFELILVDDGSPDNCGAICDANASKDSRIRVIHQLNQGVTRARANGVAIARGEFVTFVDGDDTLFPHSLETLVYHANQTTDIILGKIQQRAGTLFECPPKGEMTPKEYQEVYVSNRNISQGPVARLLRRTLFTEGIFDNIPSDIILGEDDIMNLLLAYKIKGNVYSTDSVVYHYRVNSQSVTHTSHSLTEIIKSQKYRLRIIPKEDVERYLPKGLAKRHIEYWFSRSKYRVHIPRATHEYHRYLCSILKYSGIRFGLLGRILFFCTNPLIRAIIVPLYRLRNRIRGRH